MYCVFIYIITSIIPIVYNFWQIEKIKLFWAAYKETYITILFFIFINYLNTKKNIFVSLKYFFYSSTAVSFVGIIQVIFKKIDFFIPIGVYKNYIENSHDFILNNGSRAFGTFFHPNEFGAFLIAPISIYITLFILDQKMIKKKYLLSGLFIQIIAMILTQSRGAWVGLVVSFLIINLKIQFYKNRKFIVLAISSVAMLVFAKIIIPDLNLLPGNILGRLVSIGEYKTDTAMTPRYARWRYFFEKSLNKPILGHGTIVEKKENYLFDGIAASPHNTIISLAVKKGYLSIMSILTIIFYIGIKTFQKEPDDHNIGYIILLTTSSCLIGIYLVAGQFGSFLEERQMSILFWFLIAVNLNLQKVIKIERIKNSFRNRES